jgi:hypothetical protein
MSQRSKFLAGNPLSYQSVAIALTAQTRDRHSAHRKCDLHGIGKAKRRVGCNFRLRSIGHRRFYECRAQSSRPELSQRNTEK